MNFKYFQWTKNLKILNNINNTKPLRNYKEFLSAARIMLYFFINFLRYVAICHGKKGYKSAKSCQVCWCYFSL